ncbi:MAG: T9SS type A sorting domain-containing protein [Calditrichota bacterium]
MYIFQRSVKAKVWLITALAAAISLGTQAPLISQPLADSGYLPRTSVRSSVAFETANSLVTRRDQPDEIGLQFGWPRILSGDLPLSGRAISILDIDFNRDYEISILSQEGQLYVFQHDGANFPGFPLRPYFGNRPESWDNPAHRATSAVGDVDGTGSDDLVYMTDIGYLHVVTEDGIEPRPYPLDLGRGLNAGVPAVAELDGIRGVEIVLNTYYRNPDSVAVPARLHILRNTGEELEGWPVPYPRGSASSPVVGDIDGDGVYEFVIANARRLQEPAQIGAWRLDGTRVEGFPVGRFETINQSPALVDLDGDGALEIVFWAALMDSAKAGVFAFKGDGRIVDNYPLDCSIGHPEGGIAAADINDDRAPEIVFGGLTAGGGSCIYAWTAAGEILDGFPIDIERPVLGSVILADMSGDRISDIIASLAPLRGSPGQIAAWDYQAGMIDDFPLDLAVWGGSSLATPPSVRDVDRDGDLDLLAVTTDRRVLVWDTRGLSSHDVWLTEKGGMARTGMRPADNPDAVPETNYAPEHIALTALVYPNPFNTTVLVSIPFVGAPDLKARLLDVTGRLINSFSVHSGPRPGFEFSLSAEDLGLSAGIYILQWSSGSQKGALKLVFNP